MKDSQKTEADDEGTCDVTFAVPNVTSCGGFEEEEAEKDQYFGKDASVVSEGADTESFESCDKEEDYDKAMIEAKGEMNE